MSIEPDSKPDLSCTCAAIVLEGKSGRCPEHVGYRDSAGVWWERCGDSDTTGKPYYVSRSTIVVVSR